MRALCTVLSQLLLLCNPNFVEGDGLICDPGNLDCDQMSLDLTSIDLNSRDLSGTIPPEIIRLTKLTTIFLSSNKISGTFPQQLATLPQLATMFAASKRLLCILKPRFHHCTRARASTVQRPAMPSRIGVRSCARAPTTRCSPASCRLNRRLIMLTHSREHMETQCGVHMSFISTRRSFCAYRACA